MKYLIAGTSVFFISLISPQGFATDIYECLDAQGNRTYQQLSCPEGSTLVRRKLSSSSRSDSTSNSNITATLYSIPDCASCEDIRDFFRLRGINLVDNDVSEDIKLQNELKELIGKLSVPVVVIGDATIVGYERDQLLSALSNAGYVEPGEEED